MKNLFLITAIFMLGAGAVSFAQGQVTLTTIMPNEEELWAFDSDNSYLYVNDSGDRWKVGINTTAPEGMLGVHGETGGEPALAVSGTWKNEDENPDQNSPFVIRKLANNDEALMVFIQDTSTLFHYRNDDDVGSIQFRVEVTDTVDGEPNSASDNVIMTLRGSKDADGEPGGRVGIRTTDPASQLEVYETGPETPGTVQIGYDNPSYGVLLKNYRTNDPGSYGGWASGFKIQDYDESTSTLTDLVEFRALGYLHDLNAAYIGQRYDDNPNPPYQQGPTVKFFPDTKITSFYGNVGIGTETPGAYRLNVDGDVYVDGDITRTGSCGADYVFEEDYKLMHLAELEDFIKENKHLPGMPSAKEIKENGVKIFEENRLILEKLEEAYLYIIKLEKRIAKLKQTIP